MLSPSLLDNPNNDKCDENNFTDTQQLRDTSTKEEKLGKTDADSKKRGYVIQEIITTETTYLQRLKFAIEFVIKPLKEARILSEEDVVKQFNFLELIYNLHNDHRIDGSLSQNLKFVELFDAIGHNIQCYSDYLVNYEPAMQRRAHLLIYNRRFADFIEKVEKDPQLQNQKIESLLILPVQRIPRYRLLLEQLLKYTPEDHVDYHVVQSALHNICQLAMYNNEAIRARENMNKMMEIMMSIEPTSRTDLLAEKGRKFIKEGPLLKQCRRRYKEFQFWLLSDQLLYGEMTPLGLFTLNRQILLARCKVSVLEEGDTDAKTAFIIESPAKSFKIKAKDEIEKTEWLEAVRDAVEKQKVINQDEKDAVAPVWRPDTKSDNCELCDALFTLIFRRHHCRNCGILVCDNCSSKRFRLPHVEEKKAVRVCDNCYEFLNPSSPSSSSTKPSSMVVAVNESPDESEEEELLEYRRESVDEEQLNDFNDFLDKNADMFDPQIEVALPENVMKSVQRMTPPPKPPKPNRATLNNIGTEPFISSSTAIREPRATIAAPNRAQPNRPPRKSLINSITSTVLRPTGLLQTLVGGSFSSNGDSTSAGGSVSEQKNLEPRLREDLVKEPLTLSPKTSTAVVVSPAPSGSPNSPENTSPRPARRTNVFLKPNPLLAELSAKIEKEVQKANEV